jgi:hypothetical protein
MARRTRTAKTRAQRIDMGYFKRPHPFRSWRRWLSIGVPAAAILWVGAMAAAGSRRAYSAGPVAQPHAVFEQKCERCHVAPARLFGSNVTDQACLTCHDAPAHANSRLAPPRCASCHVDHRGAVRLSAVADGSCAACHASAASMATATHPIERVGKFTDAHPEFALDRTAATDTAALKFNHAVHMKTDLRGPDGTVTLRCETCHQVQEPARMAAAGAGPAAGRMKPITFAANCASCHPLYFDPLIDDPAPHDRTSVVRAAVRRSLAEYIAANPQQVGRPDPVRGRIPINFPPPVMTTARTAAEWIEARTAVAERLLWGKTCAECHVVEPAAARGEPPTTAPTAIKAVWMPRATFDHRPHQLTACATCHAARDSRLTTDVLMPSIATCRQCHKPDRGAESRCFECHRYHDWTQAKPAHAGLDVRQIIN